MTQQITIQGIEFKSVGEAIQHTYASGRGDAIILSGRILVVAEEDADRLDEAGISFAYLIDHDLPNGKSVVVTIPVNDDR